MMDVQLPSCLSALYEVTNGLDLPGYLPDLFSSNDMSFSLIRAEHLVEWYRGQMSNDGSRGGAWTLLPHWMKVLSIGYRADGLWNRHWLPFATDGAGGVQFISTNWPSCVCQYDSETFGIRRSGRTLSAYLQWVSRRIRNGTFEVLDPS
ncbi:MAG: SMI1/KNR4 family protein [Planctomycetaceae bacterium]|nr:SMI1/KNR4 family protein [Planctomycetaceae bacterium]